MIGGLIMCLFKKWSIFSYEYPSAFALSRLVLLISNSLICAGLESGSAKSVRMVLSAA